ncbi:hypothetical protein SAMN04488589_0566 [Methanolobus vulcani]|uniref:PIN like domain-containing protein n=1 Tax=Methanolobus vulcani TaxID=38026 RepID=A0A7Z7AXF9_9EURY|nr:PIN domain-containing protein [Methanolobus vulcani]SDF45214.1 hypothetical protein SAMN04488589_0566 [Methanolobus vulcani]
MKSTFNEYYRPTDDEFDNLWNNCEFVFDANVLLNFYRYSSETSRKLFDILEEIQNRIWIPHQAALEYQKNRHNAIENAENVYNEVIKKLENKAIIKFLKENPRHPFIDSEALILKIEQFYAKLKSELEALRTDYPNSISKDDYRDTITRIFDGRVGEECSKEDLNKIYNEGKQRFANEIPPGFEDKNKPGNQKYGDLVLWHQIMKHAKLKQKPIIFITDDSKNDWWLKRKNGGKISPHPSLIKEIQVKANISFYMYTSDMFMKNVNKYLHMDINEKSIQEIKNVQHDILLDERRAEMEADPEYWEVMAEAAEAEAEYWEAMAEAEAERRAEMEADPEYWEVMAEAEAERRAEMEADSEYKEDEDI